MLVKEFQSLYDLIDDLFSYKIHLRLALLSKTPRRRWLAVTSLLRICRIVEKSIWSLNILPLILGEHRGWLISAVESRFANSPLGQNYWEYRPFCRSTQYFEFCCFFYGTRKNLKTFFRLVWTCRGNWSISSRSWQRRTISSKWSKWGKTWRCFPNCWSKWILRHGSIYSLPSFWKSCNWRARDTETCCYLHRSKY